MTDTTPRPARANYEWNEREEQFLLAHLDWTDQKIGDALDRPATGVSHQRYLLGSNDRWAVRRREVNAQATRRNYTLTPDDLKVYRDASISDMDAAAMLKRTVESADTWRNQNAIQRVGWTPTEPPAAPAKPTVTEALRALATGLTMLAEALEPTDG